MKTAALALLVTAGAGALLVASFGASPAQVAERVLQGALASPAGRGEVLYRATQFTFTGLAVALPLRAGLLNIGGEGQLVAGSLAAALVALRSPALPAPLPLALPLLAAAAAGALWGALPGFLRARTGSHEVITTIMLNFVAFGAAGQLIASRVGISGSVHTAPIAGDARLAALAAVAPGIAQGPASVAILPALALALAASLALTRTRAGLALRAVGSSRRAARVAGLPVPAILTLALAAGGACAGLAAANTVLGHKHYFELGLGGGSGFTGIAVGILARGAPLAVPLFALGFALLHYGGLVANTLVPREVVLVLQAVALFAYLAAGSPRRSVTA